MASELKSFGGLGFRVGCRPFLFFFLGGGGGVVHVCWYMLFFFLHAAHQNTEVLSLFVFLVLGGGRVRGVGVGYYDGQLRPSEFYLWSRV